ncbi:hypothetical protein KC345_g6163 [Hortaea werneckii]|nr:hypothetical protein KC345_g6163 [Hortaea werneckii]
MPPKTNALLDHVVMLLPYEDIIDPPSWITDKFHVSPGGKHADGRTENKLVLFRDGTYLELLAFTRDDSEKRKGHFWGDKANGVIDFALTPRESLDVSTLRDRLGEAGSDISYADPIEGGRRTADRQELKWKVTFPGPGVERGMVPFFCEDLTPRERRVPAMNGNTHHPCGAVGLSGVVIEVSDGHYERLNKSMGAIVNAASIEQGRYPLGTPYEIGRPDPPSVWIRRRPLDGEKEMQLKLVVQCPGKGDQPNLEQRVGEGVVLVDMVNGRHNMQE